MKFLTDHSETRATNIAGLYTMTITDKPLKFEEYALCLIEDWEYVADEQKVLNVLTKKVEIGEQY